MINLRKNLGKLQFACLHGQIYYLYHVPFLLSSDKEVKKVIVEIGTVIV